MKVKILCGVSGSGKSTYAKLLGEKTLIFSADDFFYNGKEYKFDVSLLSKAHAWCLRKFVVNIIGYGYSVNTTIIVDNTNTTVAEIAPYAALALAYGHDLEIVILNISKENLTKVASRNIHGVPQNVVEGQFNRLELLKEQLPPWWPVKNIEIEF